MIGAHLHTHTDASERDGLGTLPRLIQEAKKQGFKALAMTDHGTLANAVAFIIQCIENGLKPLLGVEGYVAVDGEIGHITLLVDGNAGWSNIVKLQNKAHKSNFKQPAFTIDQLIEHSGDVVCLTGCLASPLQRLSPNESLNLARRLKGAFGGRLFAELMFNSDADSFSRPLWLSEQLGLKRVITNDVHFPLKTDGNVHKDLTLMKSGFNYDSAQLYLKKREAIIESAVAKGYDRQQAINDWNMSDVIATKLDVVNLKRDPELPHVTQPQLDELEKTVWNSPRLPAGNQDYIDRVEYELGVIKSMGFLDYFYILDDIVREAKKMGVPVGAGRGSGAGSLVLFLMGITDIDPLKFGLIFERFLNPKRVSMPDVDVDFGTNKRQMVLDYANKKWGGVPIATYSRWSHKSLVRDLGRYFRIDQKMIEECAERDDKCQAFEDIANIEPRFAECYYAFLGQIRHKGKHAGGVIITDVEVPVERLGKEALGASWAEGGNESALSYAGVVKFDLLGVSSLGALDLMQQYTGEVAKLPEDDPAPFALFQQGKLNGIFQFAGSEGIKTLTQALHPETFEELIAINALYRPATIQSGATEMFPKWKKNPRKVHPYIADVLEETFGAVVYQEQVMTIYARTVDGDLGDADFVRKLMAKSKKGDPIWERKFEETTNKFIEGAVKSHGLTQQEAMALWGELATHAGYSFNKSHSTAYSLLSWQMAWFKFYHPVAFYTAMMNIDTENVQKYIIDAVNDGIEIKPPHVNVSSSQYEFDGNSIFMPFTSIKFFGASGAVALVAEREQFGKFDSLTNFTKRIPKSVVRARGRQGLLATGGFDGLTSGTIQESCKILSVKEFDTLQGRDLHLAYFGSIIPSKKLLDRMNHYENNGWTCGIVSKVETRNKGRGDYWVHYLSPNGVFWSPKVQLTKGEVVAVIIDDNNGKLKRVKQL